MEIIIHRAREARKGGKMENYQQLSNQALELSYKLGEIKIFPVTGIDGGKVSLHVPKMGKRREREITVNLSRHYAQKIKVGDQLALVYETAGTMTMTQPVAVVPQEGEPWRIKP